MPQTEMPGDLTDAQMRAWQATIRVLTEREAFLTALLRDALARCGDGA